MSIPKPNQVAPMVSAIRDAPLRKIQLDLIAALEREDRCGTTVADGFPPSTMGGGSSGISRPTETTMLAREKHRSDRQRECASNAWEALCTAAGALARAQKQLQNIADLRADAPITPLGCEMCTSAGLTDAKAWEHRGNVAGRLSRDMYLCDPHYRITQKLNHAPSDEQTRQWERTGSWKVKVSA